MFRLRGVTEYLLLALLVVAVLLGGGGANYGLLNSVVQFTALVALGICWTAFGAFWDRLLTSERILLIVTLSFPLFQAIPLPQAIWQSLPGRELVVQSYELIDADAAWLPVSVDLHRTLLAATGLIVPFVTFVLAASMPSERSSIVIWAIIGLAVVSVLVGAVQLTTANQYLSWYPNRDSDEVYGFFANHNSTGLFFVIAITLLIGLPSIERPDTLSRLVRYGLVAVFAVATVLTQSRSSVALLVVPFGYWMYIRFRSGGGVSWKRVGQAAAFLIAAIVGVFLIILKNDKLSQTLVRFEELDDMRWAIWEDSSYAIAHYWPIGSGVGTFRETFEVFESLEAVSRLTAGRAHNDYLELALEGGIFALLLLIAWLFYISILQRRAMAFSQSTSRSRIPNWVPLACMLSMVAIALQSAIDYPLRNQALLCVAASLLGILWSHGRKGGPTDQSEKGIQC